MDFQQAFLDLTALIAIFSGGIFNIINKNPIVSGLIFNIIIFKHILLFNNYRV